MLAELIGARRPSVSKALGELGDAGALRWTGEFWLLPGDPPASAPAAAPPVSAGPGNRRRRHTDDRRRHVDGVAPRSHG